MQLLSMSPLIPAAAAAAAGIPKATGGFLAALSSFMSEQQRCQQVGEFAPLQARGSMSPGVPASVAAEAEALAAARRSPVATDVFNAAPTLPPLRENCLKPGETAPSLVSLRAADSPVQTEAAPTITAEAGVPGAAAVWSLKDQYHQNQSGQLQQQRRVQRQNLLIRPHGDSRNQEAHASVLQQQSQQQQVAAQLSESGNPGTRQGTSSHLDHLQQQQQHRDAAAITNAGIVLQSAEGPSTMPDIEVLPCDWLAALEAAGAPASKREMSSLAALNPAEPLPAVLTPLLLPALAQVVLLLHRWLLLQSDELVAAAAVASSCSEDQSCVQNSGLEQLLVQYGVMEQMIELTVAAEELQGSVKSHSLTGPDTGSSSKNTCAAGQGPQDTGNRSITPAVGMAPHPPFPTAASSAHHGASLCCNHSSCYRLLLSAHGAAGQRELAAAVLKLLGSAAAAAVHTVSLPGLLLRGDVCKGLVAAVQEAILRTGRGQLLVLYVPRIEVSSYSRSYSH